MSFRNPSPLWRQVVVGAVYGTVGLLGGMLIAVGIGHLTLCTAAGVMLGFAVGMIMEHDEGDSGLRPDDRPWNRHDGQ